jgi:hypothetical protein
MTEEEVNFVCKKCNKQFAQEGRYKNHIDNVESPCDYVCPGCKKACGSRRSWQRHKKMCKLYDVVLKDAKSNVVNAVNNSNNTNNNNTNNNNTQNNVDNQQVVMMQPFDVDHYYMKKAERVKPCGGIVLEMLRHQRFGDVYEVIFKQVHGNEKVPEQHNIFIEDPESGNVVVFKGKNFKYERSEKTIPRLFDRLKYEAQWAVKTDPTLDEEERQQLLWDIQANWMVTDRCNDPNIRRILRNNKAVVLNTLSKYIVKPDKKMVEKWLALKDHPAQGDKRLPSVRFINSTIDLDGGDLDEDHIVALP